MENLQCIHCGQLHPITTKICPITGKPLLGVRVCSNCGSVIEEKWKLCAYCGYKINIAEAGPLINHKKSPSLWVLLIIFFGILAISYWLLNSRSINGKTLNATDGMIPTKAIITLASVPLSLYPTQQTVLSKTSIPQPEAAIVPSNATHLTELARWGDGMMTDLAWSPDGKEIIISSSVGIYYFNTATLTKSRYLDTQQAVYVIDYSIKSNLLAAGYLNGKIDLFTQNGHKSCTLAGHTGSIYDLIFSPDGNMLASSSEDMTVKMWDVIHCRESYSINTEELLRNVVFSPDSKTIALGFGSGIVKILSVLDGQEQQTFQVENWLNGLAFSPDGTLLAVAYNEDKVKIFTLSTGQEYRNLEFSPHWEAGGFRFRRSLSFSPDGTAIVSSCARSARLMMWDVATGRELRSLVDQINSDNYVVDADYSPDGSLLVTGFTGGKIKIWDTQNWVEVQSGNILTIMVDEITYSSDGNYLTAYRAGNVFVFDTSTGTKIIHYNDTPDYDSRGLFFSPTNRSLTIVGRTDIKIWDSSSGKLSTLSIPGLENSDWVTRASFSQNGDRLAISTASGKILVIDRENVQITNSFIMSPAPHSIAISPNKNFLAACSNSSINFWNLGDGRMISEIPTNNFTCAIRFSWNNELLIAVLLSDQNNPLTRNSAEVKIFEIANGKELISIPTANEGIKSIAISPDGSLFVTGSEDGSIRLWKSSTGQEIYITRNSSGLPSGLTFSPDGHLIASCSWDGTIRLWGVSQ